MAVFTLTNANLVPRGNVIKIGGQTFIKAYQVGHGQVSKTIIAVSVNDWTIYEIDANQEVQNYGPAKLLGHP